MNFDTASLIVSSLIGLVGFGLFMYGKKQQRPPQLVVGVLFMVFPYFVPNALGMVAIAAGLASALWVAIQRGH